MRHPKTFHYPVPPNIREGPWYEIGDGVVTWRGYELDADADSFVALSDSWGVDDNHVYVQYSRRRGIDRSSFRLLNPIFAVDKNAVYDWSGKVKKADPDSFETLDAGVFVSDEELIPESVYMGYGRDHEGIFFHEQMSGRASLLTRADRASFRSLGYGYGCDDKTVFFRKSKIQKSDPDTWIRLGREFSMDHSRVWYQTEELRDVKRDNFFVLNLPGTGLATDGSRYFEGCFEVSQKAFFKLVAERIQDSRNQAEEVRDI